MAYQRCGEVTGSKNAKGQPCRYPARDGAACRWHGSNPPSPPPAAAMRQEQRAAKLKRLGAKVSEGLLAIEEILDEADDDDLHGERFVAAVASKIAAQNDVSSLNRAAHIIGGLVARRDRRKYLDAKLAQSAGAPDPAVNEPERPELLASTLARLADVRERLRIIDDATSEKDEPDVGVVA